MTSERHARRYAFAAIAFCYSCVVSVSAQALQIDSLTASLASARRAQSSGTIGAAPATTADRERMNTAGEYAPSLEKVSRYQKRNHLTEEERRTSSNRAPRGLVPPEFRGKPLSQQALEEANLAILRRRMDPYAYLVGATSGTVLPPEARLVPCGGNDRHLFYTLGKEDPILLHNLAIRKGVKDRIFTEWSAPDASKVKPSEAPAATIARAAAYLRAHGYKPVPTWLEPRLFAPIVERPGQASVRVNITENARMALAFCGYGGETPPPSGPGIEVRVHFPA
jgi:hypothetical protein